MARKTSQTLLTEAINDIADHGFDSQKRIFDWMKALHEAAEATLTSRRIMEKMLRDALKAIYKRLVTNAGVLKYHPGIERYTLEKIKPSLRAELDRRIVASAELIKLNRETAIQQTLQRFSGWSTSIPKGGSDAVKKSKEKKEIRKALASLPFEERRVLIDQSAKLSAAISDIVAVDGGAIAAIWHSHWRQAGYDYREHHKDRDGQVYLIRDSWAAKAGYVKAGKAGYSDKMTQPGEEVYCRCYWQFLYNIRQLPADILTQKGKDKLAAVRAEIKASRADSESEVMQNKSAYQSSSLRITGPQHNTRPRSFAGGALWKGRLDESTSGELVRGTDSLRRPDWPIFSGAKQLDKLGYLKGLRSVTTIPDRNRWHSSYEPDRDEIEIQEKFYKARPEKQMHMLLHEAGHRGQEVDHETYEKFKELHLNQMPYFRDMANREHLADARRHGVENVAEEVFAESYARYMLGLEMPRELWEFWDERRAT